MIFTRLKVVGERPADAPKGTIIFNAPRPLFGQINWKGDFRHGIFYVALNPGDEHFERCARENLSLDAWVIEYVTQEHAIETAREYYKGKRPQLLANWEPDHPTLLAFMETYFYNNLAKGEVEIDV